MKHIPYVEPNVEEWLATFKFDSKIKVRFSETDALGHVNNVSYFIYFEQARMEYFNTLDDESGFRGGEVGAFGIVTGDLHCHYLQPIFHHQTIKVKVRTAKLGRSSLDLQYAIVDAQDETLLATCRGAMIHVDSDQGKVTSTPWPEAIRQAIIDFEPAPIA